MSQGFENVMQALARARESFLSDDERPSEVRSEIFSSWRRSALSGADPAVASIPYSPEVDLDGRLCRAAYPVLNRLAERLADTSTALLLADPDARILARWSHRPEVLRMMDRTDSAPGFSLTEEACGTNGLGSVVEERRPLYVLGAEHFADRFVEYACYGAPIKNPVTSRLEGVITLVCPSRDSSSLMMPFVLEMSDAIEERLKSLATRRDEALLEAFSRAGNSTRRPMIAVNEKTIITNPAAARLLDGADHAVVWEYAAEAISSREVTRGTVSLKSGTEIGVTFRPLLEASDILGAIGELAPCPPRILDDHDSVTTVRSPRKRLRGLVGGSSRPWLHAIDRAESAADSGEPMLIMGEPGTGKFHLARALCEQVSPLDEVHVFDGALGSVEGPGKWLQRIERCLRQPGFVILRHLELVDHGTALALASLNDIADLPTIGHARIIGLFTTSGDARTSAVGPHLDGLAVHRVVIPPLRERSEDIPELARKLIHAHSKGAHLQSEVCQALMRCEWPGNVRQLAGVMRSVAAARPNGAIDLSDLPAEVIGGNAPSLSFLEQIEQQAILQALRSANGNKKLAATELGIARSTLYRKLRTYGIDLDRSIF